MVHTRIFRLTCLWFSLVCFGAILLPGCSRVSREDSERADLVASQKIMGRADYLKTVALSSDVVHGKSLSEQNVDWLLAVAKDPRFTGRARALRCMYVSLAFAPAKLSQLPKSRVDNIYNFGVALVHMPDQGDINNSMGGCCILGSLGNKAAIAEIQPLLSSGNMETRKVAQDSLENLEDDPRPVQTTAPGRGRNS